MKVSLISSKKAQVEIIGLAVLVILLVFILIIALSFSFSSEDNYADVRKSLIANNLLNAAIKEQGKINIKELVNECYIEKQKGIDNGQDCLRLKNELNKIFSIILGRTAYQIRIKSEEIEFFKEGSCEKGIESTSYRFRTKENLFIAILRVC